MLFEYMGQPIQFRLVELNEGEESELSELIIANGGVVSENSLIKFTSKNAYIGGGDAYLVDFIRDCVKHNKILDITEYKYGAKGIGCPMSQFLTGSTSCMVLANMDATLCPSHRSTLLDKSVKMPRLINDQVRIKNEHNYGDNIVSVKHFPDMKIEEVMLPTTDTEGSVSDSMFYPDESQSLNGCLRLDSDVANRETFGSELVTDVPSPVRFEEKGYNDTSNELETESRKDVENIHSQLPDDSNRLSLLGGTRIDDILKAENFRLTSSDSDETIENNTSSWIECRRKKSSETSSNDDTAWSSSQDETTNVTSRTKGTKVQQPSCSTWTGTRKSISKNKPSIQGKPTRKSENEIISVSDSDSDTSDKGPNRFPISTNRLHHYNRIVQSTARRRRPIHRNFDSWEQQEMVNYLIKNDFISEGRGNRVWKQMIEEGLLKHRTVHSLNNHFRRYILPNIHVYRMDSESREKFRRLKE
ncbi:uncharacterized protein LOC124411316 [Diprion similis]|uniref:uncharacterized protein LOC124411316 n=1 Tax=Diprion similis TaxID=362088 RepID=UPI001EF84B00|nr:uncharacterized protein LOC124411316 [Diprion similis]